MRGIYMRFLSCLLLLIASSVLGQSTQNVWLDKKWAEMPAKERHRAFNLTTPPYQKEVLRLVIEEANRLAQELNLPEQLPITKSNLVETVIPPPSIAAIIRGIGSVRTSNYVYAAFSGSDFSVVRKHWEREYDEMEAQIAAHEFPYRWPVSRMDTNAAYQLAAQWLKAVSVDVAGLNRDLHFRIRAWTPPEAGKDYFVPIYWVSWSKKWKPPSGVEIQMKLEWEPVAQVELFLPTQTLRQLVVYDPKYILRHPVVVTNLDFFLSQTNRSPQASAPPLN